MTHTDQTVCKNCRYAKKAQYRQIICGKTNTWHSELDSCNRFEKIPCGDCPKNGLNDCDPSCGYLRYK